MELKEKVGFMQGRLSPIIDGKIQCFPKQFWKNEFAIAQACGFKLMEWTLDIDGLYQNPLLESKEKVREISSENNIKISSITGDCFMQDPFYKGVYRQEKIDCLKTVISAASEINIEKLLIPLVDNGKVENIDQEKTIIDTLLSLHNFLKLKRVKITFESDLGPSKLAHFIDKLPADSFGITYDIGNSASLGYSPSEEIQAYGHRICHVHIKDRLKGGETVPLGQGNADFCQVFKCLKNINYQSDFILQTARATNNNHKEVLCDYRDYVLNFFDNIH
ncbi:MAG: sugar phosphate isomerase/epimerase family protein [Oligoflexales bacterium]